jgi:hypothetical protein
MIDLRGGGLLAAFPSSTPVLRMMGCNVVYDQNEVGGRGGGEPTHFLQNTVFKKGSSAPLDPSRAWVTQSPRLQSREMGGAVKLHFAFATGEEKGRMKEG